MRRLFTILTITALITGCSWMWENVPGRAEEVKKGLPQAQQIEKLMGAVLDWKFKYYGEVEKVGKMGKRVAELEGGIMLNQGKIRTLTDELKQAKSTIKFISQRDVPVKNEKE